MSDLRAFLRDTFNHEPKDLALFERALTHGSVGKDSYERLEFVGDRVARGFIRHHVLLLFAPKPNVGAQSLEHRADCVLL